MTKILLLVLTVSSCNQVKNLISKIKGNQQQPQEQVQVEKVELPSITEAMALEELKDLPPRQTEYMNLAQEKKNMFDVSFINEAARVIRGISPAEDDIATWFNAISQGGTREGLMNGLMVDNYYRRLETKDNPLSSEVKEFTKQYMAVFLAQEFSDDVLNGVNMYTLKRVLSEKTMLLLSKLKGRDEAWDSWYGMYSAFLAQKYSTVWKNHPLRSNPTPMFHKKWASGVPREHVLSETIIKLHVMINTLNQVQ